MPSADETKFADNLIELLSDVVRGKPSGRPNPWTDLKNAASEPLQILSLSALERDYFVFRQALLLLVRWHRETFPAVYFSEGALPVNPTNPRLMLSNDPLSVGLRDQWQQQPPSRPFQSITNDGDPIDLSINTAIQIFSNGIAPPTISSSQLSLSIINFEVTSQNSHYHVHYTDEYWYSPVRFGNKTSTPVSDHLLPANYKFGGELDAGIIWDAGIHTVSQTHTSTTVKAF